jgi:hypothetical protein
MFPPITRDTSEGQTVRPVFTDKKAAALVRDENCFFPTHTVRRFGVLPRAYIYPSPLKSMFRPRYPGGVTVSFFWDRLLPQGLQF